MIKTLILIIVALFYIPYVHATTYWVDSVGTITNKANCSGETPLDGTSCCTPATLFNATDLTGGDIVYFRAGDGGLYTANGSDYSVPAYYPHSSGTNNSTRLIFKAYDNETVVFRMSGLYPVLGLNGENYVTLDGFTLWARDASNNTFGTMAIEETTYSTVQNCLFEGYDIPSNGDLYNAIHVTDSDYVTISNCLIRNFKSDGGDAANVTGICFYRSDNCIIEKSTFYSNNTHISWKAGDATQQSGLTIRQCLFYDTDPLNTVSGEYCAVYIGYTSNLGRFYQNIFIDTGFTPYDAGNKQDTYFYNNTFIGGMDAFDGNPAGSNLAVYSNDVAGWKWYNNLHVAKANARYIDFAYGSSYGSPAAGGINHNGYWDNGYSETWRIESTTYSNYTNWSATYTTEVNIASDPFAAYAATPTDSNANGYYDGTEIEIYQLESGSTAKTASDTNGPIGAYITDNEQIGYLDPTLGGESPSAPASTYNGACSQK